MDSFTALVPDEVPEGVGGEAADLLHGVVIAGEVVQTQRGPGGRQARPGQLHEEREAAARDPLQRELLVAEEAGQQPQRLEREPADQSEVSIVVT